LGLSIRIYKYSVPVYWVFYISQGNPKFQTELVLSYELLSCGVCTCTFSFQVCELENDLWRRTSWCALSSQVILRTRLACLVVGTNIFGYIRWVFKLIMYILIYLYRTHENCCWRSDEPWYFRCPPINLNILEDNHLSESVK
jgi:hypothetical protein